jgi:hypothetical protein
MPAAGTTLAESLIRVKKNESWNKWSGERKRPKNLHFKRLFEKTGVVRG